LDRDNATERFRRAGRSSLRTKEPGPVALLGLVLLTAVIFVLFICLFQNYFAKVVDFGDSESYIRIASGIRHWNFDGLVPEQFWGLPYAMAAVSTTTTISDLAALLLVCLVSSFASVILAARLWGGWVAAFFAVLNFDWMQRSYLGGSEPLFVALIFASFLAVRRDHWPLAALLAAFATVVRPLGIFCLLAIGLMLLLRREFRRLALATAIGLAVGALYVLPMRLYFGSALANVHGYSPTGQLFGIPFYAIIKGTILYHSSWTNLVLTFGWIFFVLAGMLAMWLNKDYRQHARQFPVEALFGVFYLISVFCYNYPYWARGTFPRFVIPVLPLILLALLRWIRKDRRLIWALAVGSPLLAAASAIGIANVATILRRVAHP
jgi:hypothetical protein